MKIFTKFFFKKLKEKPFMLAPMDEVTDLGFRKLCEEFGSSWTTTELTNVNSIISEGCSKARYEKRIFKNECYSTFWKRT